MANEDEALKQHKPRTNNFGMPQADYTTPTGHRPEVRWQFGDPKVTKPRTVAPAPKESRWSTFRGNLANLMGAHGLRSRFNLGANNDTMEDIRFSAGQAIKTPQEAGVTHNFPREALNWGSPNATAEDRLDYEDYLQKHNLTDEDFRRWYDYRTALMRQQGAWHEQANELKRHGNSLAARQYVYQSVGDVASGYGGTRYVTNGTSTLAGAGKFTAGAVPWLAAKLNPGFKQENYADLRASIEHNIPSNSFWSPYAGRMVDEEEIGYRRSMNDMLAGVDTQRSIANFIADTRGPLGNLPGKAIGLVGKGAMAVKPVAKVVSKVKPAGDAYNKAMEWAYKRWYTRYGLGGGMRGLKEQVQNAPTNMVSLAAQPYMDDYADPVIQRWMLSPEGVVTNVALRAVLPGQLANLAKLKAGTKAAEAGAAETAAATAAKAPEAVAAAPGEFAPPGIMSEVADQMLLPIVGANYVDKGLRSIDHPYVQSHFDAQLRNAVQSEHAYGPGTDREAQNREYVDTAAAYIERARQTDPNVSEEEALRPYHESIVEDARAGLLNPGAVAFLPREYRNKALNNFFYAEINARVRGKSAFNPGKYFDMYALSQEDPATLDRHFTELINESPVARQVAVQAARAELLDRMSGAPRDDNQDPKAKVVANSLLRVMNDKDVDEMTEGVFKTTEQVRAMKPEERLEYADQLANLTDSFIDVSGGMPKLENPAMKRAMKNTMDHIVQISAENGYVATRVGAALLRRQAAGGKFDPAVMEQLASAIIQRGPDKFLGEIAPDDAAPFVNALFSKDGLEGISKLGPQGQALVAYMKDNFQTAMCNKWKEDPLKYTPAMASMYLSSKGLTGMGKYASNPLFFYGGLALLLFLGGSLLLGGNNDNATPTITVNTGSNQQATVDFGQLARR